MPRAAFFTKETITAAGLEIVRAGGEDSLTARALSKALHCSSSPIFTVYEGMDKIKEDVRTAGQSLAKARTSRPWSRISQSRDLNMTGKSSKASMSRSLSEDSKSICATPLSKRMWKSGLNLLSEASRSGSLKEQLSRLP